MPWSTITVAEFLLEGFNTTERASVLSAAGGDDGLATILTAAIAEWRGVIAAAGADLDADTTTVPPSTRRHIVAQCRWQLLVKLPNLPMLQTDARKEAAERAEEVLEMIAKRELPVEPPEEDDDEDLTGGSSGGQARLPMRTDSQESYDP